MQDSRVYRLLKLMNLLRSGGKLGADELSKAMGISRRTFFRDIELLNQIGISCDFQHDENQYAISGEYFLSPLQLDVQEAMALLLVTRKFLSREVHPAYQKAMVAALKIESVLPRAMIEHCGARLDGISVRRHPNTTAERAPRKFRDIQSAMSECKSLRVVYDSVWDQREITTLLDPLRLIYMSRGWYLLARSHVHGEVRTFKLDRFIKLEVTDQLFTPDPTFSEANYFGDAWRMIPEGRVYDIMLRFSSEVATSVEEVHWHDNQVTARLSDGRLLFEARIDGLKEIATWILGYGDQVEILAPVELRELIRRKAERMLALATSPPAPHGNLGAA